MLTRIDYAQSSAGLMCSPLPAVAAVGHELHCVGLTCCIIACVSSTASQDKLQAAKMEVQGAMRAEGRERQVSEVCTRTRQPASRAPSSPGRVLCLCGREWLGQ